LIFDRQFGFLKETFVAPVPRLDHPRRILGGATVAFLQGLISFGLPDCGFSLARHRRSSVAFLFMALIGIVFSAVGSAIGSALSDAQVFSS